METVLLDMVRWVVGFCIVSAIYLAVGLWLIRRFRKRRSERKPAAVPSAADPQKGPFPNPASQPDQTGDKNES